MEEPSKVTHVGYSLDSE
jgi:hypothetical protein